MANKFTVLLDMDSTVYDLLNPTLDYVNAKYGLNLGSDNITEWRWDKKYNVDPTEFWNTKGTYFNLKPFRNAVEAIKKVHDQGIRQVFFSSANFTYATEKFQAVDRDFPFIGSKDVILTGGNKDLLNGDVLVDDGPHNLKAFDTELIHPKQRYTVLANLHQAPYCYYPLADASFIGWKAYPTIIKNLIFKKHGWTENVG